MGCCRFDQLRESILVQQGLISMALPSSSSSRDDRFPHWQAAVKKIVRMQVEAKEKRQRRYDLAAPFRLSGEMVH